MFQFCDEWLKNKRWLWVFDWKEIDGNEESVRTWFKTTQRTNIHLCSFQLKLCVCMCVNIFCSDSLLFCWFVLNELEEEGQTIVANDCSRLMKTGFSCESSLSCRVSILGIMRVICGDYQQMKMMSICLWWTDRVHLELWQIGMELNGDNFESHIHHWIVCCCWRTSWFQLMFIDTKKRDDGKNHLLFLNWLFQWDGHKTRDCHCHWWWCLSNCAYKMTNMFFLTLFHILLLEGMTLMNLWLNWWINMVTQ
jgi:hypothetical protein